MKYTILILLPFLIACASEGTDKEKKLLEKELELTKKELELKNREQKFESKTIEAKNIESLIFTTKDLSSNKQVSLNGKQYQITMRKTYVEEDDPTFDYTTSLSFSPNDIPEIMVPGNVYSFALKDVNFDGTEEIIAATLSNGTWATIYTYQMYKKQEWKEFIKPFMWWTDSEGCDAKIYSNPGTKQVRILTTNSASQSFDCTDESFQKWK